MAKAVRKDSANKVKTGVASPAGSEPAKPREATVHTLPTPTPLSAAPNPNPSPQNFVCRFNVGPSGSGKFSITYVGPLALRDEACLRYGVKRAGGGAWGESGEAKLRSDGMRTSSTTLDIAPGSALESVQFAVRAGEAWDNGGRAPLGYYEWRPGGELLALA